MCMVMGETHRGKCANVTHNTHHYRMLLLVETAYLFSGLVCVYIPLCSMGKWREGK